MLAAKDAGRRKRSDDAGGKQYVFSRPVVRRTARARARSCSPTRCTVLDDDAEEARRRQGGRVPGGLGAHRARRAVLRARRHRAGDLPGPAHLAADQDARVARRSDRARRSRDPRRDHVAATRSACSARTSTTWPTSSSILLRETAEKATLEKELEVARTIQETLVPPPRSGRARLRQVRRLLPAGVAVRRRLVDVCTTCPTARVLVVIGDVTGHGVPSAMITAAAKAACDVVRATDGDDAHGDAPARDHEPRHLRERQAQVRDDLLRVDRRPEDAHDHVRQRRPQLPVPVPARRGDGKGDFRSLMIRGNRLGDLEESKYEAKTHRARSRRRPRLVHGRHRRVRERARRGVRREAVPRGDPPRRRRSTPARCARASSRTRGQFFGERARKDDITMVFARIAS